MTDEACDTLAAQIQVATTNHNTVARSCLARNSHIRFIDRDGLCQGNDTRDIEHYGTRTGNHLQCPAQRTLGTIILQAGHMNSLSTTSTEGIAAITLSTRECQLVDAEREHLALDGITGSRHLIHAPIVDVQRA